MQKYYAIDYFAIGGMDASGLVAAKALYRNESNHKVRASYYVCFYFALLKKPIS